MTAGIRYCFNKLLNEYHGSLQEAAQYYAGAGTQAQADVANYMAILAKIEKATYPHRASSRLGPLGEGQPEDALLGVFAGTRSLLYPSPYKGRITVENCTTDLGQRGK